ncbi:hypothetical protein OK349_07835 [Sphingomonas sp. BT-65]|uniref:hypothetical protein n=1 Tax=Sphingomonas sp. BT-65 TaxID=2989821 RepID=UPI0022357EB8|nr:hypothetical protein [Sphingomonas sp. BT-65]MCW4461615.1 hypothetical protein [Sphingomonas sp. BT-65]
MQTPLTHRIVVDRPRKLVIVEVHAILSPEDAGWVGEELRAAIRTFGDEVGQHVTLYDVSGVAAVPTATIDMLMHTFDNPAVRALWARKVAFVVTNATGRMQVKRLQKVRPDFGIFGVREEAVAWLLEP